MKKISNQQKQEISGGVAPMLVWTGLIGLSMLIGAISNFATNMAVSGTNTGNGSSNYNNVARSNTRARISYRPSYTSFFTDI